jgi:hypothetical protein
MGGIAMHCPDGVNGCEYIELVAAAAMVLARDLDVRSIFLLAEFMQAVSSQLFTLGAFKDAEEHKKKPHP